MGKNKIGNNNRIKNSNISGNDINISNTAEKKHKKIFTIFLIPLMVTIIGGVIVALILSFIKP